MSYGKGTKSVSEDRGLIRYLMRHSHTTPLEMCEIKLHIKIPMDTWRQMIRHRTANVNEYSTRYSEAIDDKAVTLPGEWRFQSGANKQGSGGFLPEDVGAMLSNREAVFHRESANVYQERLLHGVAREQARKDLPLSTYCYDAETEVLTEDGFVRWPDVKKGQKLGVWDAEANTLCYEEPTYLTKDAYEGPMYRVEHRGVDLSVTPHHKMWVKLKTNSTEWQENYALVPAQDLGDRTCVRYNRCAPYNKPAPWNSQFTGGLREKGQAHATDCSDPRALLSLMGFFIGDGNAPLTGDKNALVFSLKKLRKIEFLGALCKRLGWTCELRSRRQYVVRQEGITDLFRDLFYDPETREKRVPDFMLGLGADDAGAVLDGLKNSDGSIYAKRGSWKFITTSTQVAERTIHLGVNAGEAVAGPFTTKREVPYRDLLVVRFSTNREPVVNQMNQNTSWENYKGFVYCAKTRTGVLVVRRNKRVVLSGNTEAYWKIDLHNLLHFLSLRMDAHAQLEIRSCANVIGDIVKLWVPNVWEAFNDYNFRRSAILLTRLDAEIVAACIAGAAINMDAPRGVGSILHPAIALASESGWLDKRADGSLKDNRERIECEAKLKKLGIAAPWL